MQTTGNTPLKAVKAWRTQAFGFVRIAFGLVWANDATFKW